MPLLITSMCINTKIYYWEQQEQRDQHRISCEHYQKHDPSAQVHLVVG